MGERREQRGPKEEGQSPSKELSFALTRWVCSGTRGTTRETRRRRAEHLMPRCRTRAGCETTGPRRVWQCHCRIFAFVTLLSVRRFLNTIAGGPHRHRAAPHPRAHWRWTHKAKSITLAHGTRSTVLPVQKLSHRSFSVRLRCVSIAPKWLLISVAIHSSSASARPVPTL